MAVSGLEGEGRWAGGFCGEVGGGPRPWLWVSGLATMVWWSVLRAGQSSSRAASRVGGLAEAGALCCLLLLSSWDTSPVFSFLQMVFSWWTPAILHRLSQALVACCVHFSFVVAPRGEALRLIVGHRGEGNGGFLPGHSSDSCVCVCQDPLWPSQAVQL